jgi:hypothetical protein
MILVRSYRVPVIIMVVLIVLSLTGCPTTKFPTILITAEGSDTALVSGESYLFGDVVWGETKAVTFTITNNGQADLTLTSDALVSIGGVDASEFSVTTLPAFTLIPVGGTATFTITFSPADTGKKAAMVTIPTDYPDDQTVSFMLCGTGVKRWRAVGSAGFSSGTVSDVSLAIDGSTGTPYVAYIDQSLFSGYPVVKMLSSESWNTLGDAGIDDPFVQSYPFYSPSLYMDGSTPLLVYACNYDGYCLDYKVYSSSTWNEVGYSSNFSGDPHKYISVKLDGNGDFYVAFRDAYNEGKASVYRYADGAIVPASAGFTTNAVSYTSLGFVGTKPYIAFKDDVTGKANVYSSGEGLMSYGNPDFSDGDADYTSLALNSNGVVYVAYSDGYRGGKVTVMENDDGESWTAVGSKGFSAGRASYVNLACDANGTLFVAYKDDGNGGKLTVQEYNGSSWDTVGIAGSTPDTVSHVSMALHGGTPYVAFSDDSKNGKITVMKPE